MTDHRSRDSDPFDSPEDYGDPWREHRGMIFVGAAAVLVLLVILVILM